MDYTNITLGYIRKQTEEYVYIQVHVDDLEYWIRQIRKRGDTFLSAKAAT